MLSKNTREQAVQEDIETLKTLRFSYGSEQAFNSSFDSISRKIVLMTWGPSMLPPFLWYLAHISLVKTDADSVLRTCLGLGIMNISFSIVLLVFMFKSIHTYLNFKDDIKNRLKLGCAVDNLIKRTAQFMCVSSAIISLGVAFSSEPSLIGWAWPVVFFPSLLVAKVLYSIEKKRIGLTALVGKIKRRIHDEEKRTWIKLWPNVM
jgi:hypothetical protein